MLLLYAQQISFSIIRECPYARLLLRWGEKTTQGAPKKGQGCFFIKVIHHENGAFPGILIEKTIDLYLMYISNDNKQNELLYRLK